jgi:RNA polymerase sigma-70 factor, ECF subfamily
VTVAPHLEDFSELAAPYRRELLAHCYRMLGSIHDAEDLLQETMLRAWQGYPRFEGRSSLRVWLYRIATNACLRALSQRQRLPLPSGLGAPNPDPGPADLERTAEAWMEPFPTALMPPDPAEVAVRRDGMRLAFVGALQLLPARQRATLILREVLEFSAEETADVLDMTVAAVNSALQRARKQLATLRVTQDDVVEVTEPARREMLDRYVRAFETSDVRLLAALLREDIVIEMPPVALWIAGLEPVLRFLAEQFPVCGQFRLLETSANGQPAFAVYRRQADGAFVPRGIHVLSMTAAGIDHLVSFLDPALFPAFGLPPALPADA